MHTGTIFIQSFEWPLLGIIMDGAWTFSLSSNIYFVFVSLAGTFMRLAHMATKSNGWIKVSLTNITFELFLHVLFLHLLLNFLCRFPISFVGCCKHSKFLIYGRWTESNLELFFNKRWCTCCCIYRLSKRRSEGKSRLRMSSTFWTEF